MSGLQIYWSNRLEQLAEQMFNALYNTTDYTPLEPRCIVTNSPVMQAWLRHYFVFEWPQRQNKVLANCDFQLLYPFVNDWLDRLLAEHPQQKREPRAHPYSTTNLQWRIYKLMTENKLDTFSEIENYLGESPLPRMQFQLAGKLATIFDDYQVYRCDVVTEWNEADTGSDWQARLWRVITDDNPNSYAELFTKINNVSTVQIQSRFAGKYKRVSIFGTTTMPPPYISFLDQVMAKATNVDMYLLNPSQGYWLEDASGKKLEKITDKLVAENLVLEEDPLMVPENGHELLCSLGESLQDYLYVLNDQCLSSQDNFVPPSTSRLLNHLQTDILNYTPECTDTANLQPSDNDNSIQIHICHNPRREVEVLHDFLLDQFTQIKDGKQLQPYQVQVLVTDMDSYAPHINAVFGTQNHDLPDHIPYAIDRQSSASDSEVLSAFMQICNTANSRFQVSAIVDILNNDAVMSAFALTVSDIENIELILKNANIRWGINRQHRASELGSEMPEYMTWEYGLDRLLLGYATGTCALHNDLLTSNLAEGASAELLGRLAGFFAKLKTCREKIISHQTGSALPDWHKILTEVLETFFVSTENTYRELTRIRQAVDEIPLLADSCNLAEKLIPFDVIMAHLEKALEQSSTGDKLTANAVVFSQLRPMNSRPSEVICLLGLNDGTFPRRDNRPTFDLLANTRRRLDRSLRRDDRCAFLETIINARKMLYISYTGRTDRDNEPMPPSIVLQELKDHLSANYTIPRASLIDGSSAMRIETLHHINAVHPDYFDNKIEKLFSYSQKNLEAAKLIIADCSKDAAGQDAATGIAADQPDDIDLNTLKTFFSNPAKFFYKTRLGAEFDIRKSILPDDDEPMELGPLEKYGVKKLIVENMLDSGGLAFTDSDDLICRLQAEGSLPLGDAGRAKLTELKSDIEDWIESPCLLPGITIPPIIKLLKIKQSQTATPAAIRFDDNHQTIVSGSYQLLNTLTTEGQSIDIIFEAQPSTLKVKTILNGWLTHVFACATSQANAIRTIMVGIQKKSSPESYGFNPIASRDAKNILKELVGLYQQGLNNIIPFAPETSWAYCEELKAAKTAGSPQAALYKAAKKWGRRSDKNNIFANECRDQALFHAFGEGGPYNTDQEFFVKTSLTVFSPLQSATITEKDGE